MSTDGVPQPFRGPWEGDTKILIGIDIGTTQSGVAFAFLKRGESQALHRVTRWPGQEAHNQQARIPTLIWYDNNAKAVAFGAEALSYAVEEEAEDNALPPGVSIRQIYSDFLGYLLKNTRAVFENRLLDGRMIWQQYSPTMEVVIAHPNGWGIREQEFLRAAAVAAGFSTSDQASSKICFVTEAEASIQFCVYHTNLGTVLQPGMNFAVCDAGGSTVDTTLYSVASTYPILRIEEKRASACVQAGAIFVDLQAEGYLRRILQVGGLNQDDIVEYTSAGVKDFESGAKRVFKDEISDQSVVIAHTRFNYAAIRARRGRITLPGSVVKSFFDVCMKEIVCSVDQQLSGFNVPHILLVGGFGDSPYLRQEFRKRYEPQGCQVSSTNDSSSKAVADGAVLWAVAQRTFPRVLQFSWGIETSVTFDPNDPDHVQRKGAPSTLGWTTVPGRWKKLVRKGAPLEGENMATIIPFSLEFPASTGLSIFELDIYSYSGDDEPVWMMNKQGTHDYLKS
ncbi:unnamed protein product [Rhizoctonia solani]|uniref:Uncharacterized protein n=1 Tax=Rhizoctonia solani TaxID=456999 RepID=A0A8H3HB45_9AGAM|nr:unnamed protein product [Rhizoctonia solani]CAE6533254.1 unnamed protein product [Rhizoctonia solani]